LLRTDGNAIAVYECGERRGSIPLKVLERVVLQGTIRLDTRVLGRLAEAGVPTVLLGGRSSRRVAILIGPAHNDAAIRLAQFRQALDGDWCAAWSRGFVHAKAQGQLRLLREALGERLEARKPLFDAIEQVQAISRTLGEEQEVLDLDLDRIRGLEGACAAAYFRAYGALFADSFNFRGRNRRPPRDPVNAALSFAYTLLHFDAVRAAHAVGLDPMVGFYHQPAHSRESLACDLIEPLRPRADAWICTLFRERVVRGEHFAVDKGACLLGKAGREHFYAAWESFAPLHRRWLRRQCAAPVTAVRQLGELFEGGDDGEGADDP
jgi:CRISP-associated protein Cas1